MKKSKIIAPALAVLTLSTAAAVTGTVAWFTAGRVKNVAMSGITAINPETGLALTVSEVKHTTVTGNDTDGWSVAHSSLRDGSVDVKTGNAFGSVLSDAGDVIGYKAAGNTTDGYAAGKVGETNIYYATAFDAKFKLSRTGGYPYNLYFDATTSLATFSDNVDAFDEDTSIINALRIGLYVNSTTYWVWAPKTQETAVKFVKQAVTSDGTTAEEIEADLAAARGDYTVDADTKDHSILAGGAALPAAEVINETTSPKASAVKGYLGALNVNATTTLDVRVYTWFEGLDDDCINAAANLATSFSVDLSFKMIRSA